MEYNPLTLCTIIAAGEVADKPYIVDDAFVIAADGGYDNAVKFGITPEVVIGDLDSVVLPLQPGSTVTSFRDKANTYTPDVFEATIPIPSDRPAPGERKKPRVIRFPVEKDDTDMMLAIRTAYAAECRTFLLYGGVGGRLDHTLANIQALNWIARRGALGYLIGGGNILTVVVNGIIAINGTAGKKLSVFSIGDRSDGVNIEGCKYPLSDAVLTEDVPLGVSNEFTSSPAIVSVASGALLICWEEDTFTPDCVIEHTWGDRI